MRTILSTIFPTIFPPYAKHALTLFEVHAHSGHLSIFLLYQEGARPSVVRELGPVTLYTPR